ncbi:Bifunctional phosphatase IMPL2, chloroplastic [Nymphon striatum]|nr:Bifunctional phosphatase IMPL2, chloroplastic [Nymphon striatum]
MARLDSSEKGEIMRVAHRLADAARAAILPHFRSSALTSENKLESGFDPVTVADRAAEQAMRDILLSERPNDGILGEEFGSTNGSSVGSTAEGAAFAQVSDAVKLTRFGMDCYAYALVAAGQVDLVIEACLNPYDIHAPIAVIQAAGGVVTNWAGGPAHDGGRALAAATPELHAQALKVLQSMGAWDD